MPRLADTLAEVSSAAQGKPFPSAFADGDHVGHDAVEIGGERMADAAAAALHFIEDELRADLIAAAAQRFEVGFAEVHRAGETLYRLDDHCRRALRDLRSDGRRGRRAA